MELKGMRLTGAIIVICAIIATVQAASAAPTISVEPSHIEVSQGDTFTVNITIDPDGTGVMGAQYTLYFDNVLLKALNQSRGPFLRHDGKNTNVFKNKIYNTIGEIKYGETRIDTDVGVTTPGVLSTIEFEVRCSGVGELRLGNVKLSDPVAGPISTEVNNATIEITQSQPSTPFVIRGYIFHEDESDCNDPAVNVTNLNIGKEWTAGTGASSNYYQLTLSSCADVIAGEVLRFDATSPDGSQNTTEHTVTQDEVNGGGISNFNITLASSDIAPYLVIYTISNTTISPDGDGIMDDTEIDVKFSESVNAAIKIENASGVVKSLYTSSSVTNPDPKTWDGTDVNDNIVADGTYHVNITMNDGVNPLVYNNTETITVLTSPDTTPPVITDVANSTPTDSSVTITWTTNEASGSLVRYGTTSGVYTDDVSNMAMTTSHSIDLSGLSAGTTYYFVVNSTDASDNSNESAEHSFTTSSTADTDPPVITDVVNSTPTDSSVTITWTTDENSDSLVKYGTVSGTYTDSTPGATMMTTSHSVGLSGLSAGTTYYFVVNSTDASGNSAQSTEFSFTTATVIPTSTTVSIEDVTVSPGESVVVPIMVNSVTNLGGCMINMTYNASVVHVTDVTPGDMDLLACNINNGSGWMYANAINYSEFGLSGNVVFAYVNLTAVGGDGDTSPLNITVEHLFDVGYDNITHTVINGTFTTGAEDSEPPLVTDASASRNTILNDNGRPRAPGTNVTVLNVTVTDSGSDVANVTINLSSIGGSPVQPMEQIPETNIWTVTMNATAGINLTHQLTINATDNDGNYNNTVAIQLTVLRRGDVCRDDTIDHKDVMYIARYLAGLEPESTNPPDVLVGDVVGVAGEPEGDGVVNLMDALYMARYGAGFEIEP